MPAAVAVPLITAGVGAAAGLGGAAMSSNANTNAANTNAAASEKAAQIAADAQKYSTDAQANALSQALGFEQQVYGRKQQQVSPDVGYGQGALAALGAGLGVPMTAQPPIPSLPTIGANGVAIPPAGTITNGLPQRITNGNWSTTTPPAAQQPQNVANLTVTPGTQRVINGVPAVWDGRGWKAVQ